MTKPFRLTMRSECAWTLQQLDEYASTVEESRIGTSSPHGRKLAIVGGGPSVVDHLDELRGWGGDIWSVNSTGQWLLQNGIESTFVTVDPSEPGKFATEGIDSAILATCCHPDLRNKFNECSFFDLIEQAEDGIIGGTTTASRMPFLAVKMGYSQISLFGCESSFKLGEPDHIDRDTGVKELLIIKSQGVEYVTNLQFALQAEHLSDLVQLAPEVFIDRSGGLLEGMLCDADGWEVVAVSAQLKENIEKYSGSYGWYDKPYTPGQTGVQGG